MLVNNSPSSVLNETLLLNRNKNINKQEVELFLHILKSYNLLNPYYIALHLHEDQYRKYSKEAYINHPVRVCLNAYKALYDFNCHKAFYESEELSNLFSSCLLHDVLEDTNATTSLLLEQDINTEVVTSVGVLTKHKDYNDRLKNSNVLVKLVKLADIEDNLECNLSDLCREQLVKRFSYLQEKSEQLAYLRHKNLTRYYNYLKAKIKEQRRDIENELNKPSVYNYLDYYLAYKL